MSRVYWSTEVARGNIPAILHLGSNDSVCYIYMILSDLSEGINLHFYEGINLPILSASETRETLTIKLASGKYSFIIVNL
jgi:hypothetical protein